ncbi:MAG: hypothetical protein GC129_04570 [Proteobacteria bacterium]|nr:hypothetical protein [Pseudomonadota bacterium]
MWCTSWPQAKSSNPAARNWPNNLKPKATMPSSVTRNSSPVTSHAAHTSSSHHQPPSHSKRVTGHGLRVTVMQRTPATIPLGLPTPKVEAWKFTNLARKVEELRCTPLCTTVGCLEAALPVVAGPQAVFHNGTFAENLSESLTLAPGVTLTTVSAQQPAHPLDKLDELTAPAHHTFTVQGTVKLPLHLIHVMSGQPSVARFTIQLAQGASLTLVEHHVAAPRFASWQHTGVEIHLAEGASLTHCVLQILPPACMLSRRETLQLAPTASATSTQLQVGGVFSRTETHTHLSTQNNFKHTGLALTRHNQQHDATLVTHHTGESNQTHIRQRNLIDDQGHAVFQGKFYVAKPAQKTDAYMHCHNMLLSDHARASHKPELEIYADDVKCSHGAATGGLDGAQLFYLQARGLSVPQARALLLTGYALEFIEEFPEPLRAGLTTRLQSWLAEVPFKPEEDADFVPIEGPWLAERAEQPHAIVIPNHEEILDE